jgi:hypothetical protein
MTFSLAWTIPALALVAQSPAGQPVTDVTRGLAEQIACAPMSPAAPPAGSPRVWGGYQHGRIMFGPGDTLIVAAGAKQGLQKGQTYYVRRHVLDMFTPAAEDFTPVSIHTAGWVTIVDTRDDTAVAQVVHACDGILDGDYLEPYTDPVIPDPLPVGAPDYDNPARIVMGDQTTQTGSAGTLMVINRGSEQGVRAGQTLVIYRETLAGLAPSFDVGRGTILSVLPKTSVLRIDSSRDAVYIGDLAALSKIP